VLGYNRPISHHRVTAALHRVADAAGISKVTDHQLRHTLATQAVNRGMRLDAMTALLGPKTLAMTMVYARIADKSVADEYFANTEKVDALYGQPNRLADDDEGREMRELRTEMHRRRLGNGYCARQVGMDCHFKPPVRRRPTRDDRLLAARPHRNQPRHPARDDTLTTKATPRNRSSPGLFHTRTSLTGDDATMGQDR
jgi:hypothetical protein